MKKTFLKLSLLIISILSLLFVSVACGGKGFKESFTGTWKASQNTLNGNIYTGNIVLMVNDDNTFTISDDMGIVNMSGKLTIKDDINIELKCGGENFAPPSFWNASEIDEYEYDFISEDVVVIEYLGNKLAFFKGVDNNTPSELKNDNWLTNNGLEEGEITYRVEITDEDIDFYIVDGENIVRIIHGRNLIYDADKKTISFVPDTSVGYDPPTVWYSDLGKEIKEVVLDVVQKDNYITLSYNGIEIKFYNDLLYNMDTSSDIYYLMDSSWSFQSNEGTYEINLLFGDSIFINGLDGNGDLSFSGMILLDENNKTMDFYFDQKNEDAAFWGGLQDEMLMNYNVSRDKLELTYNGITLEFNNMQQ